MSRTILFLMIMLLWIEGTKAQEVILPLAPDTTNKPAVVVNLQPLSEIDIPVRINLKPVYGWANNFVDTLYTSPNYPNDWVMDGCDTRYQYRFIRGPFRFRATNNALFAAFTGFYGVRGSTRICSRLGNSPWTPPCSCGFGTEKPRRIDAGFAVQFKLLPDYKLGLSITNTNPTAVDKCEVCFFGKDITQTVATTLKEELDLSINEMKGQLQTFSLRPYLQQVWDTLQAAWHMPGFGYMSMQPEALRISQATLRNDSMYFSLGLTARPELKPLPSATRKPLPNITDFNRRSGFALFIAQYLPYDSLNGVLNEQAAGKEFSAGKGLLKKTVRIDSAKLLGGGDKIFIKVYVSKAIKGIIYLEGKPVWNTTEQVLEIDNIDFQINTKQVLVKSAAYMLDGTIEEKLKQYTRFDLKEKSSELNSELMKQMNKTIIPGVESKGYLLALRIDKLEAADKGIFLAGTAQGKLWIDIEAGQLMKSFLQ